MVKRYDVPAILRRFEIMVEWREGTKLFALCPFHLRTVGREASKPTWFIRGAGNRAGQSHCFSCGEGGGLPWLVMHVLGLQGASAAVDWLDEFEAEDEPIPHTVSLRVDTRMMGRPEFVMPAGVVEDEPLAEWPERVREYAEGRGLTALQVRRWGIAYALEGWLEGRLVIPVHDGLSDLCGYMARAMFPTRRKYLFPSLADGVDLDALFGERHWPPTRRRAYACEGALNALAVERAIPGAAVAALGGSELRPMHAAKLATFAEVALLTDPDEAGDKAAGQLRASLGRHCRLARVSLPAGRDANNLTAEELRACVDASVTGSDSRAATSGR